MLYFESKINNLILFIMNKLSKMNDAKAEKTLSKLICYDNKAMTKKQWLICLFNEGYKTNIASVSPVQYNRNKWNSMNEHEQKAYQERMDERVTEYRAINERGIIFVLTRTEYNFLDDLIHPYASESELNHLFGLDK